MLPSTGAGCCNVPSMYKVSGGAQRRSGPPVPTGRWGSPGCPAPGSVPSGAWLTPIRFLGNLVRCCCSLGLVLPPPGKAGLLEITSYLERSWAQRGQRRDVTP